MVAIPEEEPALKRLRTDESEAVLSHLATRGNIGTPAAVVVKKDGMRTTLRRGAELQQTLAVGAACSEVFCGKVLAKVLRPAVERQTQALASMESGEDFEPLSVHTSVGVPPAAASFLAELEKHMPWERSGSDWMVNLHLDGTTAVWAAVEALMKLQVVRGHSRPNLGAAEASYHGPNTTGLGFPAQPRWPGAPRTSGQRAYPRPRLELADKPQEMLDDFLRRFDAFLGFSQCLVRYRAVIHCTEGTNASRMHICE
eukprot:TRINITY_DN20501_c0_g1_i2.p1 TRINITY_DN20501_c0_g1~~TRINITY_DN20501_c0_g1_i2.p1  ORF type:complete len:256 (+),score=39.22 TRINITY_DN20501_c0_g1_i2:86-853(+)